MAGAAYGFRLDAALPADALAVTDVDHWPVMRVEWEDQPEVGPGDLVLVRPEGKVCLQRDLSRVRLPCRSGMPLTDLVHPVLASAGWLAAWARGEEVFHAGGFVTDAGAWIVLGDAEAGKSTLLAELHGQGWAIVADDEAVIREGRVCSGPRSIDLRPDVPGRLGGGTSVRQGRRRRIDLPPITGEHPVAGFVQLVWSDRFHVAALSPAQRLALLVARTGRAASRDRRHLVDLAALPMYRVERAREWSSSEAVLERLINLGDRAA